MKFPLHTLQETHITFAMIKGRRFPTSIEPALKDIMEDFNLPLSPDNVEHVIKNILFLEITKVVYLLHTEQPFRVYPTGDFLEMQPPPITLLKLSSLSEIIDQLNIWSRTFYSDKPECPPDSWFTSYAVNNSCEKLLESKPYIDSPAYIIQDNLLWLHQNGFRQCLTFLMYANQFKFFRYRPKSLDKIPSLNELSSKKYNQLIQEVQYFNEHR